MGSRAGPVVTAHTAGAAGAGVRTPHSPPPSHALQINQIATSLLARIGLFGSPTAATAATVPPAIWAEADALIGAVVAAVRDVPDGEPSAVVKELVQTANDVVDLATATLRFRLRSATAAPPGTATDTAAVTSARNCLQLLGFMAFYSDTVAKIDRVRSESLLSTVVHALCTTDDKVAASLCVWCLRSQTLNNRILTLPCNREFQRAIARIIDPAAVGCLTIQAIHVLLRVMPTIALEPALYTNWLCEIWTRGLAAAVVSQDPQLQGPAVSLLLRWQQELKRPELPVCQAFRASLQDPAWLGQLKVLGMPDYLSTLSQPNAKMAGNVMRILYAAISLAFGEHTMSKDDWRRLGLFIMSVFPSVVTQPALTVAWFEGWPSMYPHVKAATPALKARENMVSPFVGLCKDPNNHLPTAEGRAAVWRAWLGVFELLPMFVTDNALFESYTRLFLEFMLTEGAQDAQVLTHILQFLLHLIPSSSPDQVACTLDAIVEHRRLWNTALHTAFELLHSSGTRELANAAGCLVLGLLGNGLLASALDEECKTALVMDVALAVLAAPNSHWMTDIEVHLCDCCRHSCPNIAGSLTLPAAASPWLEQPDNPLCCIILGLLLLNSDAPATDLPFWLQAAATAGVLDRIPAVLSTAVSLKAGRELQRSSTLSACPPASIFQWAIGISTQVLHGIKDMQSVLAATFVDCLRLPVLLNDVLCLSIRADAQLADMWQALLPLLNTQLDANPALLRVVLDGLVSTLPGMHTSVCTAAAVTRATTARIVCLTLSELLPRCMSAATVASTDPEPDPPFRFDYRGEDAHGDAVTASLSDIILRLQAPPNCAVFVRFIACVAYAGRLARVGEMLEQHCQLMERVFRHDCISKVWQWVFWALQQELCEHVHSMRSGSAVVMQVVACFRDWCGALLSWLSTLKQERTRVRALRLFFPALTVGLSSTYTDIVTAAKTLWTSGFEKQVPSVAIPSALTRALEVPSQASTTMVSTTSMSQEVVRSWERRPSQGSDDIPSSAPAAMGMRKSASEGGTPSTAVAATAPAPASLQCESLELDSLGAPPPKRSQSSVSELDSPPPAQRPRLASATTQPLSVPSQSSEPVIVSDSVAADSELAMMLRQVITSLRSTTALDSQERKLARELLGLLTSNLDMSSPPLTSAQPSPPE